MELGALRTEHYEVWMPFEDARVLIRYVGPDELRRLAGQAKRRRGGPQRQDEADAGELNRLLGRAAVRGWEGFTMAGQEYAYGEDHCDFLMDRWSEFARFVVEAALDLGRLVAQEDRQTEKNSGLTCGQDATTRG